MGYVTSATHSPRLKQNIALAMVAIDFADLGTELKVETSLGIEAATVTKVPFI